ncbi:hypothetical protein [Okeania sp. SIO2B9]|uniref:hypothetical protein n=1 Tax=Okeania sp. SIO2B9 TaxID=2607782 RepID=UPI00142B2A18|nr:hypothetical protein [Okeania sp. SIO2B9]NES90922.1 hypothetical protein [Okeania sp. SIO2B9]
MFLTHSIVLKSSKRIEALGLIVKEDYYFGFGELEAENYRHTLHYYPYYQNNMGSATSPFKAKYFWSLAQIPVTKITSECL